MQTTADSVMSRGPPVGRHLSTFGTRYTNGYFLGSQVPEFSQGRGFAPPSSIPWVFENEAMLSHLSLALRAWTSCKHLGAVSKHTLILRAQNPFVKFQRITMASMTLLFEEIAPIRSWLTHFHMNLVKIFVGTNICVDKLKQKLKAEENQPLLSCCFCVLGFPKISSCGKCWYDDIIGRQWVTIWAEGKKKKITICKCKVV